MVRSEAVGDPHFLRMRNTELTTRMKEVEKENVRLKDQVRKATPGADSPPRKKKVEKRMTEVTSVGAENAASRREMAPINAGREEFPPPTAEDPSQHDPRGHGSTGSAPGCPSVHGHGGHGGGVSSDTADKSATRCA